MFKIIGALSILADFGLLWLYSVGSTLVPTDPKLLFGVMLFGGMGLIALGSILDGPMSKRSRLQQRYNGRSIPQGLNSRPLPSQRPMPDFPYESYDNTGYGQRTGHESQPQPYQRPQQYPPGQSQGPKLRR